MQIMEKRRVSRRVRLEASRIINRGDIIYLRFVSDNVVRALVRGSSDVYVVTVDLKTGKATCTCTAAAYGRYCKHIEAVKLILKNLGTNKNVSTVSRNLHHHTSRSFSVSRAHHTHPTL
jgi:uncharacterized Zn finger protein